MIIGVPKEIKKQEHRVALLPSAAYQLIKHSHEVLVQRGAGVGSGFSDEEYERAGAKLVDAPERISARGTDRQGEGAAAVRGSHAPSRPVAFYLFASGR